MSDKSLVDELRRWATEEFNLPPDSLPNNNYLKTLCVGNGRSIWKYMIQHVYSQRNVRIMRGNLQWYQTLQDKELKKAEGQSEAAKRRELQTKIEQLRSEIIVVDSQIRGTEEQLAAQERSISCIKGQIKDSQCRELILQAFRQRCSLGRQILSDDLKKIDGHCQGLEEIARKAEIEMLYESEPSDIMDDKRGNVKGGAEAQVLRELRALCDDRVQFYQSLQESELKLPNSANRHMTREQRTTVYQYWLSSVEKVLGDYPPNHVLSALQYLAFREQTELEKKLVSADVTQDLTSLRFQYESNRFLDVSLEEKNELPPVKTLLEAAWEEVQQSQVELAQTRRRVQGLKQQLVVRKKETAAADELHCDAAALSALEVELQGVMQAAALDHIRDFCIQLDRHAKSRQEALRSLHNQWQSILDFRELVALRQEQIRGLIRGNSTGKTQLIRLHKELQEFIEGKVLPQFADVINAATDLRNSISKEARQFGSVSLVSLDRRVVDGIRRVPASSLSIHRLASPNFSSLCQNLSFPVHKAPEELCSQARYLQLDFRFLRRLLQLYTTSLQNVQTEAEQLHASDQKALLNRIKEEDQRILKSLLPRARGLTQGCAQALSYRDQFQTAISHWWDKPAQHVLPEVSKGGLTFQQWLQRWKLAAKDL
ncbi:HAUS augmin-like complex subunit 5 [Oryzias latipes]|nr:HAUS augmin-like complex subunit 5 [Oryzias latipes]XP_011472882.1 HAUS augmin-like complex subunit 5 [Oryzias latipes]XP_011472883.1 HAUS augmin-like complex subunit 5 [Oryzias latipes]XP_020558438.1 HAUS augmin-like complex subunit 5 [Oryzias latipes]